MDAPHPLPVEALRARFPALRSGSTVYLDNAAGAQVPQDVIDRIVEAMTEMQVNKGGAYAQSKRVTAAKEAVRARTARFVGGAAEEIAFGPNATTLITLLARAVGDTLEPGDEIVVTGLDHNANIDPWRALERRGAVLRTWRPRGPEARLDVDDLVPLLGPRTRLVALTAASNLLGTLTPVREASARIHEVGALAMVDAVHYAPHRLPDVHAFGCDALVFSPYKVVGPHLGALWLGERARDRVTGHPLAFMDAGPIAWETGTQNHEAILGWGAALDYLEDLGGKGAGDRDAWQRAYAAIEGHEQALAEHMLAGLAGLGYEVHGLPGAQGRTATVAFSHPTWAPESVARFLAERDIAVAAGHAYAFDLVHEHLGLGERGGAVRASALHYTDEDDVDRLLGALAQARDAAPPS